MTKTGTMAIAAMLLSGAAYPQVRPQKPGDDQLIRIGTQLIQWDVVVTDKNGQVVSDLAKSDFELYESGKKQQLSFFEFVSANRGRAPRPGEEVSPQGLGEADVRRIFAFVVDDLTIRNEDLVYVREMLTNFVNNQMRPRDLVAIVRTVGGKSLLQEFSASKELLMRAIAALTPATHPLNVFDTGPSLSGVNSPLPAQPVGGVETVSPLPSLEVASDVADFSNPVDDSYKILRAYMTLGAASFVVDGMKQLPGRKSLVLISGGLPILTAQYSSVAGNVSYFINQLSDRATRAGVAIHAMDIRGLSGQAPVARFVDTPGNSGLAASTSDLSRNPSEAGRIPDERLQGNRNPFDITEAHMGLKALASATGGIAVLNRNNFNEGLGKIVSASDGYYMLAYTPSDPNFKSEFRKIEVKVKRDGLKVYSRRGYVAREERAAEGPSSKQDQLLAALKSPLARREVDLDAVLLYKAAPPSNGAIDIDLLISPAKLAFDKVDGKQQADLDVAGFVFDELGKLKGGFSETINAKLTPEEYAKVSKGGLTYTASTTLPPGPYQIKVAVRDNKSGNIGTLSRYIEIPNLSKGRLTASSLLLGEAPPNDTKAGNPIPMTASRQISRKNDLRYAVMIYNAKMKDGKPQIRTQLTISQNGRLLVQDEDEPLAVSSAGSSLIKVGQLGLSRVKPGRYTITLRITDTLADKKAQTVTRNMDFIVVE